MLVRCKPSCRQNGGMTDASLDVKDDCVICNDCGEVLENISSYTKASMKRVGDIIRRKNRKAFTFSCKECGESMDVKVEGDRVIGSQCDSDNYNCKFSITSNMINAIKMINIGNNSESDNE